MNEEQPTILVVEDDRILQELYLERFTSSDLQVLQAFDGMQAVDIVAAHPEIALVVLDIMIPRLSGYDVLSRLRREPATKQLPIICVSALGDLDDKARALQLGATDYVTKGEMLPGAVVEKIKGYVLPVPGPEEQ